MALAPGAKLGPYELRQLVGRGGMGEVYRAIDTRLDRTVAIKVLASHLSTSPELKQRMEREARSVSALNHPHICQLYDVGSQDGCDFLVMEFLEGETLAERLAKGPLPLTEIYTIGIAIAEALELAHRQGIVHRDLKPANIMLVQGNAKLMDFGLAKPLDRQGKGASTPAPSFSAMPTMSGPNPLGPLTSAGTIVGTIQYMAPEQIEGKNVDARTDIFALGAVLYEMAAGKAAFQGRSQISLASSILEKDPEPVSSVKPQVPHAFEHLVTTCLQKDPECRFQSAHDVKLELQWIATDKATVPPVAPDQKVRGNKRYVWTGVVVAATLLGAFAGFSLHSQRRADVIRATLDPPAKTTFNLTGDFAGPPVLSPDGTFIAFSAIDPSGKTALWVRPANSLESRVLPDTAGGMFPFWSPDSHSVGFFANSKLKTIDITGSSAQVIADAPFGRGGTWGIGGMIIFSPDSQASLMKVPSSGGIPVNVTKVNRTYQTSHRWPFFLPDGKHFLYLALNHDPALSGNDAIYYASVDGKENRELIHSESNAICAADFLIFAQGDQLMAQPFRPKTGKLGGMPGMIAKGVTNDITTWHMDASASDDGLLVFGTAENASWQLVWVDRTGKQTGIAADKLQNLQVARISPQGDRVALQIENAEADIWVLSLSRGALTRLTFGPSASVCPAWSPDGKWIAYSSQRDGHFNIYRKPSDGSGGENLLQSDTQQLAVTDWSRDGRYLIYSRAGSDANWELWALPLDGSVKPYMVIPRAIASVTAGGRVSPDGHWIVYASNESSRSEIYVAGFNGTQGKWQVSSNGGELPQWSNDGKEIFYMDASFTFYSIPVHTAGNALQFGDPITLVRNWSAPDIAYDVAPDGKRILLDRASPQVNGGVTVVANFITPSK